MSYSQSTITPGNFPIPKKTGERFLLDDNQFTNRLSRAVGDPQSLWISFPYQLNQLNGTTYDLGGWVMAPDTLLWVRYQKEEAGKYVFTYDNPNICAAGSTTDLYSQVLQLPNLYEYTPYTVDSAGITYIYSRFTSNDVVDTLIVQLYKTNHMLNGWYFNMPNGDKRSFAIPYYNRTTNLGSPYDAIIKIPLTIDDTSRREGDVSYFRTRFFQLPTWALTNGGNFALTYAFKPGKPYKLNDTIPLAKWDSVQGVTNPINAFRMAVYGDNGQNSLNPETNHGLWILNWCRYKDWNTTQPAFAGTYFPGNGWNSPLYPVVLFKINYTESNSMNHLAKDVKVLLYPSPASNGRDMTLDLTLDGKKSISIDVYDMLGHQVASVASGTYSSGQHKFSVNTSDLNAGMYICNIMANGEVKTIKFEVR